MDKVLRRRPEIPGVVVFDTVGVCGAISRSRFQQLISRPFGGEIVRPRAIGSLLSDLAVGGAAILDAKTPIQDALRVSLSRDPAIIYEPILVSSDGSEDVRLIGFTDLLRADSRISLLRNQQMSEILATVQEGFVLVDREHRIASEYSRSVEAILGRNDLAGRTLPDVLRDLLGSDAGELAYGYLETLFNPNVIEKLVADINPLQTVQLPERAGSPGRTLAFAFRRSVEGKEIRRVLVRLEDRTREVELAAELAEQERQASQRVDLALEMMRAAPDALTDYLTRFLAELSRLGRLRGEGDLDAVFRILHGLKGEAGLIGLRSFAQKLHAAEDVVASLRGAPEPRALGRLDPWIDSLRILGAEAKDLVTRLSAIVSRKPSPPPDLAAAIASLIDELSTRLGKPARFVARWRAEDLPPAYTGIIRDALIQFARNAMVHGVETEQQRRLAGKAVTATLQFAVRRHEAEGQLEIVFQDDGRGLDLDLIRHRAGELFGSEGLEDQQAMQVIFEPAFSTAATTTGDAGRGVGLDLVRERVEGAGGTVLVHSEPGIFCAFQIILPLEHSR